ncbi:uncharacterized protein [Misgurnus anguillicaudatus]|uniref:uncharacterized protein n=1 Tax=Misgurnus anguillicaudatus TaxID=75329 RepID=UPI003CCFC63F
MSSRKSWTQSLEQNLIELWQEHECLYDVSHEMYHNRAEKEKRWTEIANALNQPDFTVDDIKTRAVSLRTQYCRLMKPKPSGSGNKPWTPRQKWLLSVMDFIKTYIVHWPSETTLGASFNEQSDADDMDLSDIRPDTPSVDSPQCTASTPNRCNEEASTSAEETTSTASSDSCKQTGRNTNLHKRKRVSEGAIELQKLDLLKQMVAQVDSQPTMDTLSSFGNQVALELRDIQDPVLVSQLKRSIMVLIYNAQETDRNRSLSSSGQPTPGMYQQVNSGLPSAQPISQQSYYGSGHGFHRSLLESQPERAYD